MSQFETGSVLDRIEMSHNLRGSLQRAITYAYEQSHRQVTLEHLLLALADDREAAVILESSSVNVPALITDVSAYLGGLDDRVVDGQRRQPELGGDVQHIIQSAGAAAQKSQRRAVSSALVLAAVVGDGRSPSAQILRNHGLTFENAIAALKQANVAASARPAQPAGAGAAPGPSEPSVPQAAAPDAARPIPASAAPAPGPMSAPNAPPPPGSGSAARLQNMQAAHEIIAGARERIAAARGAIAARSGDPLAPPPGELQPPGVPQYVDQAPEVPTLVAAQDKVAPPTEAAQAPPQSQPSQQVQPAARPGTGPAVKSEDALRADPVIASGQPALIGSPVSPRSASASTGQSVAPETKSRAHAIPDDIVAPATPAKPQITSPTAEASSPAGRFQSPPQQSAPKLVPPPKLAPPPAFETVARPAPVIPPAPSVPKRRPDMPPPAAPPATKPTPRQARPVPPPGQAPAPTPANSLPPAHAMRPAGSAPAIGQSSSPRPGPPQAMTPPAPAPSPSRHSQNEPPQQHPPNYGQSPEPPARRPVVPTGGAQGLPEYSALPQAAPPPAFPVSPAFHPGQPPPDVTPIEPEQLASDVPTRMRVGVPTTIEIRAPRARLEAWSGGNPDPRARDEQIVIKAMVMRLKAPEGGFTIEISSPETQWSEGYMGPLSDDVVSWRWTVTPLEHGRLPLQLSVSTRVVGRDGLAAARVLPEQLVSVRVAPNYGQIASRLGIGLAIALSGLIVGYFAEGLFSMGSSILAQQ